MQLQALLFYTYLIKSRDKRKTKMFAHYFTGKGQKFVIISETMQPVGIRILVSGKTEAKRIAKDRNAKPWNF